MEIDGLINYLKEPFSKADPIAIPIPISTPILPVSAPIAMPIATPAKNFNSPLISKSPHHLTKKAIFNLSHPLFFTKKCFEMKHIKILGTKRALKPLSTTISIGTLD